jgi:hypothetical protein
MIVFVIWSPILTMCCAWQMMAMIDNDLEDEEEEENEIDDDRETNSRASLTPAPASDFAAVARRLAAARAALLDGYHRTRAQYVWRQHPQHATGPPDTTPSGPDSHGLGKHDAEAAAVAEVAAETSHLRWRNLQARVARGSSSYVHGLYFSSQLFCCVSCAAAVRLSSQVLVSITNYRIVFV